MRGLRARPACAACVRGATVMEFAGARSKDVDGTAVMMRALMYVYLCCCIDMLGHANVTIADDAISRGSVLVWSRAGGAAILPPLASARRPRAAQPQPRARTLVVSACVSAV